MFAEVHVILLTFVSVTAPMALENLKTKLKGLFKKKEKKTEEKKPEEAKPTPAETPAATTTETPAPAPAATEPAPAGKSEHSESSCDSIHAYLILG